jgi:dGTPase
MPNSSTKMYSDFDKKRRFGHGSTAAKRAEFEVDKGRIVHAAAFRRLQGKTQVLGVGERDFYRTRLTHSLEVAQLGRGLCTENSGEFRPDQDLVEAICLAHDIGHSPFGHFGEEVLHDQINKAIAKSSKEDKVKSPTKKKAPLKQGGFGANPQNLRIVALLETKYETGGLDLTRATLDGLIKYTKQYDPKKHNSSKCVYVSDEELVAWVKEGVKEPQKNPIEGQIADWADQITYSINDMEDVVRAGLLSFADLRSRSEEISVKAISKLREARVERSESSALEPPAFLLPKAVVALATLLEEQFVAPALIRDRKINLKKWTSKTIKELKEGCRIDIVQNGENSIRYKARFSVPMLAEARSILLKTIVNKLVFADPRVTTLEEKGRLVIETLFNRFCGNQELLPLDYQEMIKAGSFGSKERLIADFISGMTDRYAYSYYSRLTLPGSGSFYEFV